MNNREGNMIKNGWVDGERGIAEDRNDIGTEEEEEDRGIRITEKENEEISG